MTILRHREEAKAQAATDASDATAGEGGAVDPLEEGFDAVAAGRERQLRNVLCALILYFRRNDSLAAMGYCQGMNFVAAMLLRHMGSADAFWAMVALLQSDRCVVPGAVRTAGGGGTRASERAREAEGGAGGGVDCAARSR